MKCFVCKKRLEKDEEELCEDCFNVLKIKYPNYLDFKNVLQWHKENIIEMEED